MISAAILMGDESLDFYSLLSYLHIMPHTITQNSSSIFQLGHSIVTYKIELLKKMINRTREDMHAFYKTQDLHFCISLKYVPRTNNQYAPKIDVECFT